jgi:hypothetical protein
MKPLPRSRRTAEVGALEFNPEFFNTDSETLQQPNPLLEYLQQQSPEVLSRVAKSISPEIQDIIQHNVQGLLGMLPAEGFQVQVMTNRENMAGLLASAMMTGYFLRQMEQRMHLDVSLLGSLGDGDSTGNAE